MPVPLWAGHYIGLPFLDHGRDRRGLDCWGLVRLVLAEQYNQPLPSFIHEYQHTRAVDAISTLIQREIPAWENIPAGHEHCGDVVVLRLRGQPLHVGTVLGDGQMLHIESGINSAIERYTGPRWQDRVFGFYRFKSFP